MDSLGVEPLGDRLLVRRVKPPSETEGGLVLSDLSAEKAKTGMQRGVVLAMGDGKRIVCPDCEGSLQCDYEDCPCGDGTMTIPLQCRIGDVVVFGRWGGHGTDQFDHDGQEIIVIPESEVLAVEYEVES